MSEKVHTVAQVRDEVKSLIKSRVDAYTEELKNLRHRELAKTESEVCALCGNMENSDCSCKLEKTAVTHVPPTVQGDLQAKLEYIENKVSKDPSISVRDAQEDIKNRFGSKAYNKAVTDTLRSIKTKARKRKKMSLAQSEMPANEAKKEELDKCGEMMPVAKEEMAPVTTPPAKKGRIPGAGRPLMKTPAQVEKNLVPETMTGMPMAEAEMPESKEAKTGSVARLNAVLHRKQAGSTEKNCGSYSDMSTKSESN